MYEPRAIETTVGVGQAAGRCWPMENLLHTAVHAACSSHMSGWSSVSCAIQCIRQRGHRESTWNIALTGLIFLFVSIMS